MSLFDDVEFLFSRSDKNRAEKHRKEIAEAFDEIETSIEQLEQEANHIKAREAAFWAKEDAKDPLDDLLSEIESYKKEGWKKASA